MKEIDPPEYVFLGHLMDEKEQAIWMDGRSAGYRERDEEKAKEPFYTISVLCIVIVLFGAFALLLKGIEYLLK